MISINPNFKMIAFLVFLNNGNQKIIVTSSNHEENLNKPLI
jgi:hypothetical protein